MQFRQTEITQMTTLVLLCVCSGVQSTVFYYKLHTDNLTHTLHTHFTLTIYSLKQGNHRYQTTPALCNCTTHSTLVSADGPL